MIKVAVVQKPSVFLDKTRTIESAVESIRESASEGAQLVIFTETFVSGYPAWLWRLRPGADWGTNDALYGRLLANSVDIDSDDLKPILDIAREHRVTVTLGANECARSAGENTIYNSYLTISAEGELINRHRKLMPTNPERMVWGFGDATGLKVLSTPAGRIGSLLCWENYMPLSRYALFAQGVEIYLAPTYDSGDGWLGTLQHIAREGRCYVIGCGNLQQGSNIPDDFPEKANLYPDPDEWVNAGDSIVIAPGGEIITGPLRREEGILFAEIDLEKVATAKRALDICGHYSRPDIFDLHINTQTQSIADFSK